MNNIIVKYLVLIFSVITIASTLAIIPAYSSDSTIIPNVEDSTITKTYTCPMHPEVISDKPGECPKCGMDLILKEDGKKQDKKEHDGMMGMMGMSSTGFWLIMGGVMLAMMAVIMLLNSNK